MLHDTGRLLIAMALPLEYALILERYTAGGPSMTEREREVLGFTHAELSAEALKYWKLPEQIQIAVRDHHSSPAESIRGLIPLSHVVDAANQYTNSTGLSILARATDSADASAVELLGLDTGKLTDAAGRVPRGKQCHGGVLPIAPAVCRCLTVAVRLSRASASRSPFVRLSLRRGAGRSHAAFNSTWSVAAAALGSPPEDRNTAGTAAAFAGPLPSTTNRDVFGFVAYGLSSVRISSTGAE